MSLLRPKPKFLLDENVNVAIYKFLKNSLYDAKLVTKGISDQKVLQLSLLELRVLVTNDFDFADMEKFPASKIYCIVILRLPQNNPEILLKSFSSAIIQLIKGVKGKRFELLVDGLKKLSN